MAVPTYTRETMQHIKGELGEFQIYFRKIPLYQQNFLVVSVLSNSPWLLRNLKILQNITTKLFSVGSTFGRYVSITTVQASDFFVYCAKT